MDNRSELTVAARVAGDADIPAVVAALAEAFASDPVLAFLFDDGPDPVRHQALVTALFANRLLGGRGVDEIIVPDDPVDVREAAAVWVPPKGPDGPGPDYTMSGVVNRLALGDEVMDERLAALMPMLSAAPRTPHWYLAFVGTRPSARGRGLASALISAITRRCDEDGVGAYLESSEPVNVPLYERHGFMVTGEVAIKGGPTVPLMWRDPQR
ncbi:MAG: GNAT family N-acetyltransferase [Actinomycetota bacterium]|nr:GNAT family N-acetyltransferase [Actinomycetota bacterium]MEC9467271.1 GNAT family N-acetyltransferase [Actinomycetota bacterium]